MRNVERNRAFFEQLTALLARIPEGDEDALTLSAYAARFNIQRVTGYYSSPELERPFLSLARTLDPVEPGPEPRGDLHVLTAAPENGGGHTQIVLDWMRRFGPREPQEAALLSQGREPVPPELRRLAEESGGRIHPAPPEAGYARRAGWLRGLAAGRRRVVLSHHMFDPLPVAAFGRGELSGPVFFVNHSDHEFSLGRSVTDLWIEFRPDLRSVTRRFRGDPPSLVWPLRPAGPDEGGPELSRAEARGRLKLPAGDFVILTVAQPYKFAPVGEYDFPRFVSDNLSRRSDFHHLVVGPGPDDPLWAAAAHWIGAGRLTLAGGCPKNLLGPYLRAADVYVESFPFGGILGTLDAVEAGRPVLSRRMHEYSLTALFEKTGSLFHRAGDLTEALVGLAADPGRRADLAARQAAAAFGPQWRAERQAAFEAVENFPPGHRVTADWPAGPSTHQREAFRNQLKMKNPGFSTRDIYEKMLYWTDLLRSPARRDEVRRAWAAAGPR